VIIEQRLNKNNPGKSHRGISLPWEFDLILSKRPSGKNGQQYELRIVKKLGADFIAYKKDLDTKLHNEGEQKAWIENFAKVVEKKWNTFSLVDKRTSSFSIRIKIECKIYIAGIFSYKHHTRMEITPLYCGGMIQSKKFRMRPKDIEPSGRAAHEFGHLIGVFHNQNLEGNPLMYSNEYKGNEYPSCIENQNGIIYPERDLDFHRNWVCEQLIAHEIISKETKLSFDPTQKK
jgi:hypothetical protein